MSYKQFTNPHRISVREWRDKEGLQDTEVFQETLERLSIDSVCPVMCRECGDVEPDGRCQHGCPSLLLAVGLL